MNDSATLERIARRAYRNEHASGLSEVTIGSFLLLGAAALQVGYSALDLSAPDHNLRPAIVLLVLIALVVIGAWAVVKGVDALKERAVYPRTGVVQYRRDDPERKRFSRRAFWLAIGLGALLSPVDNSIFLVLAFLLGFGLLSYGRQTGLTRFYLHALVVVALAFVLPLLDLEQESRNTLYPATAGLYLLIAGVFAFWRFLTRFHAQGPQL